MATLAESLVSVTARPLDVRARRDLVARRQTFQGSSYWIVKEPLGLSYYRFQEEEYAILQMLDGETSLDTIRRRFETQFAPTKITPEEIARLIGRLHESGLVVSQAQGQGDQLLDRRGRNRRTKAMATFSSFLTIRLNGFDPERLLTSLYPKVRFLFSPIFALFVLLLAVSALSLITVQFDVFQRRMPAFNEFFASGNWIWLAAVLAITKVIHEFGHGLACKHFGGECHQMGVMFLVFTPCLYCDVSDSWLLPSKWHRIVIAAAGMYFEVILASIATFLWWFSTEGMLNMLCLNVMFVCSISTLLFNGNPLLRFDGYYILSDWAEIPNLQQKSQSYLSGKFSHLVLGEEPADDPFLPRKGRRFFAIYAAAAFVYRWVIVCGILWFLYQVLKPHGLQSLGQIAAAIVLFGMVARPASKLIQYIRFPGRWQSMNKARIYVALGAAAVVVLAIAFVPLPHHVTCSFEVQPHAAEKVYVELEGSLAKIHVEPGDAVVPGQPLAELRDINLEVDVVALEGERNRHEARVASLMRERFYSDDAALELPQAQEALATVKQQLAQRLADREKLTLVASVAGTVMSPPLLPDNAPKDTLSRWSGSPLDAKNQGSLLLPRTVLCQIGDPRQMQAMLYVEQSDIEFVQKGQSVRLLLDQQPYHVVASKIEEIASREAQASPARLSAKADGDLITRTDAQGREQLMTISYQAKALMVDEDELLRIGLRGQARIATEWQSLGSRLVRYMSRTFHFEM